MRLAARGSSTLEILVAFGLLGIISHAILGHAQAFHHYREARDKYDASREALEGLLRDARKTRKRETLVQNPFFTGHCSPTEVFGLSVIHCQIEQRTRRPAVFPTDMELLLWP